MDLSQSQVTEFSGFPILQSTFELLKYIRDPELAMHLPSILNVLASSALSIDVDIWIKAIGV